MNDIDLAWLKDELEEWQGSYEHPADRKQHAFFTALIGAIEELEVAQRERDEAVLLRLEVSVALSSATVRYEQAEAELKRRDAQEPVAWAHRLINKSNGVAHPWVYGSAEKEPSEGDIFRIEVAPLYTHPVPSVLPELSEE